MTYAEALGVLGLQPGAAWAEVRAAYRGLIREHHPDRAGEDATERAAEITEAYTVLETTWDDAPATTSGAGQAGATDRDDATPPPQAVWDGGTVEVLGDSIALDTDPESAFSVLLDAAHDIGEVSFVDSSIGLVEAVVKFAGTPSCSLVVSLQGRHDHVEAFCTIESLEGSPPPSVHAVVEVLADLVRQRLGAELDRPIEAPAEWLVDPDGRPGQRPAGTL
jgi:hypothetical protein